MSDSCAMVLGCEWDSQVAWLVVQKNILQGKTTEEIAAVLTGWA